VKLRAIALLATESAEISVWLEGMLRCNAGRLEHLERLPRFKVAVHHLKHAMRIGLAIYPVLVYKGEKLAVIKAKKRDLYDVLAYIAYAAKPVSRSDRVMFHKSAIFSQYFGIQQEFLDFVLDHYIKEDVRELDQDKLPQPLELKYRDLRDAVIDLGSVSDIRKVFIGFQQHLYSQQQAA
jgi:EcoEI R protein C-terminal